jgi:hypothetical protein
VEAERFDSPLEVRAVDPITISDHVPGGCLALADEELMAQSEHLGLECGPSAKLGPERCENGQKGWDHRRGSLGQIQEILNNDGPDQIPGRDSLAALLGDDARAATLNQPAPSS